MDIERVLITKRCFYYVAVVVLMIIFMPFSLYIGFRYNVLFLYVMMVVYLFLLLINIPALLAFINERIIISDEGINHISSLGKMKKINWSSVRRIYLSNCGQYTNSMIVLQLYDKKKIKIPYYLPEYDKLKIYLQERGILGMYSDSPLYAYANMEKHSKYSFLKSANMQSFDGKMVDISDVIDKVQTADYLYAADLLNKHTSIGMYESCLYIRQIMKMNK
ncbi:hypothetical protein NXH64_10515 [Butyrivibrio fibrisolvens]|uniref:hypothetical protein n=1 Tax=Pseudobutyrivibrio ruminis TaxID=46206 RepID=UPI00041DE08C|nr:hypothetical protein [Pseudobutyrivibrio ruminis]MDC7279931.1 hypothetical protein [Butyrivibrio fibrisolvens]